MNRKEMIEKLENYRMDNGYYDVEAIIANEQPELDSLSLTFAAFFGDGDEDTEATDSELVTLARELNEQIGQEKDSEVETEITELVSELKTAQVADRNRIYNRLAELGAGQIIGDSDSLEFIWNEPYGGQYDDQTGIEESGGLPGGDLPAWGGRRQGAGRKPRTDGRRLRILKVALADDEYRLIRDNTTPDSRRIALMTDKHVAPQFIEDNLTNGDIAAWHNGEMTEHLQQLLDAVGVDNIQIWGSHDGPEPLSVIVSRGGYHAS